jgi:hypothetical protein
VADDFIELTREGLSSPGAVVGLGMVIAAELEKKGVVVVFINAQGVVEMCPMEEVQLDIFPKDEAIQHLISQDYTDEMLVLYLKGRAVRKGSADA